MTQQKQIEKYQQNNKGQSKAFWLSKKDILDLLNDNPHIDGIRLYLGEDEHNKFQGYFIATVDGNDVGSPDDISRSITLKKALPCPDFCSKTIIT